MVVLELLVKITIKKTTTAALLQIFAIVITIIFVTNQIGHGTPQETEEPLFSFMLIGDTEIPGMQTITDVQGNNMTERLMYLVNYLNENSSASFAILIGDMVGIENSTDAWTQVTDIINASTKTVYPVKGNHDGFTYEGFGGHDPSSNYENYTGYPVNYFFDVEDVRLIVVGSDYPNSTQPGNVGLAISTEQETFITNAASAANKLFIVSHFPKYGWGSTIYWNNTDLIDLIAPKTLGWLAGHDHNGHDLLTGSQKAGYIDAVPHAVASYYPYNNATSEAYRLTILPYMEIYYYKNHIRVTEYDVYTGNVLQTQDFTRFSIIALPDTQHYSRDYPQIFTNQTEWVVDVASDLNVVFVSHMGDLVMNGDSIFQWENAAESMKALDEEGLSWEVLPGNHDFDGNASLANYNTYFGFGNFSGKIWFGGGFPSGTNNNNFAFFSAGGDNYLIFSFQYHPSDTVLAWASEMIARYPNRRVIVSTHDYLDLNGERTIEGNHIWNNFVVPHANEVFLVLCGHTHGEARRTDDVNGYKVHQLLADYQDRPNGGNGWLRILEFHPVEERIIVKTYSPYLNSYESDMDSQFSLEYNMKDLVVPSLIPTPLQSPEPTATPQLSPSPMPTPTTSSDALTPTPEPSPKEELLFLALGAAIALPVIGLLIFMLKKNNKKLLT